jgi:hypothetical protein
MGAGARNRFLLAPTCYPDVIQLVFVLDQIRGSAWFRLSNELGPPRTNVGAKIAGLGDASMQVELST